MIVSIHVATGGAAGALLGTRRGALLAGPLTHLVADWIPHQDIASHRFELRSGGASLLALALRRGPLEPATLGALAASLPDVEHVVALPRLGGRKLFPSHRTPGFHRAGGVAAWAQLLVAGFILGALLGGAGLNRHA